MRKVTKILLRVLSAIVLLLIILPLLPALLLAIPAVQNMAIDKAAAWAGDYLGTTVKVGQITVGLLNRVAVRDFYVADWMAIPYSTLKGLMPILVRSLR